MELVDSWLFKKRQTRFYVEYDVPDHHGVGPPCAHERFLDRQYFLSRFYTTSVLWRTQRISPVIRLSKVTLVIDTIDA